MASVTVNTNLGGYTDGDLEPLPAVPAPHPVRFRARHPGDSLLGRHLGLVHRPGRRPAGDLEARLALPAHGVERRAHGDVEGPYRRISSTVFFTDWNDFSNIAFSSAVRSSWCTFSTPPAPMVTGTPM